MNLFAESAAPYLAMVVLFILYFETIIGVWGAVNERRLVTKAKEAFDEMLATSYREMRKAESSLPRLMLAQPGRRITRSG